MDAIAEVVPGPVSALGQKRTSSVPLRMSAMGQKRTLSLSLRRPALGQHLPCSHSVDRLGTHRLDLWRPTAGVTQRWPAAASRFPIASHASWPSLSANTARGEGTAAAV